nr:DUF2059 domain-containing protein [uncultured Flavobacterium sp.]
MKKLLFVVAFAFAANFASAQDAKSDVKKMMLLTGSNSQMEMAKKQVGGMVPADKKEAFLKEFDAIMKPFQEKQEKFYQTEFTADEIKQLIKFYESPLGKKYTEKNVKLSEQNMAASQEMMGQVQELMMKYMQ